MKDPILYRRRLIPEECVLLKDDRILLHADNILVTSWQALKPRKDLHHGYSCYFSKKATKSANSMPQTTPCSTTTATSSPTTITKKRTPSSSQTSWQT